MDLASRLIFNPLLLLLILQQNVFHVLAQQIYIDKVPGYASLTACAQWPVSSIVRAQASGCGDNGALTSYSCFCYASSAAFAAIISTAVVENCTQPTPTPQAEASSAVDVFSAYCQLGAELSINSSSIVSASASVTSTKMSVSATQSSLPAKTSLAAASSSASNLPNQSGGLSTGGGIGVGIVIGLLCASLGFVLFLLRKRSLKRRAQMGSAKYHEQQGAGYDPYNKPSPAIPAAATSAMTTELPSQKEPPLTELPEKGGDITRGYELA